MLKGRMLIVLGMLTVLGCSMPGPPPPTPGPTGWPKDWSKHIGQTVTLEGTAGNAKLGAMLHGNGQTIWIDGLDAWPEGYYQGGDKGKRVRVTGKVIERSDLPVFEQKPGEPPRAGIPVQQGGDVKAARRRFLLTDAKWTLIE